MKNLTKQFQEILSNCKVESPFPEGAHLLSDLLEAVRERDDFVLGDDDDIDHDKNASPAKILEDAQYEGFRNFLRTEQRQRAEESL